MPAAISAFCCAAWPGDIFEMTPLPNRETVGVLHFNWSNDLPWKVQGFWLGEISYNERASGVKENCPSFLARKSVGNDPAVSRTTVHAIFTCWALTPCYRMKEAGKWEFRDELGSASCNEAHFFL